MIKLRLVEKFVILKYIIARLDCISSLIFVYRVLSKLMLLQLKKVEYRSSPVGRDSSLWHYLRCFNAQVLRVVHLEYDEEAVGEFAVCKALSASLCDEPLP